MKRTLALFVTLVALGAIVQFARPRPPADTSGEDKPMDCVDRMFRAASRGDVASYVDCFAGPELQAIQRSLNQESAAAVAESLRKTMSELRGWAVVDPPQDVEGKLQCTLVVERIYAGRIDRQQLELVRVLGRWKISQVKPVQPIQPPVPYGTHVSEG